VASDSLMTKLNFCVSAVICNDPENAGATH
jgi:hypothetical protein